MTQLVVETTEGIALRYEVAGAGSRSAAALVDLVLYSIGFLFLSLVAIVAATFDPTGVSGFVLGLAAGGTLLSLSLYQIAFGILWAGQSPGKRLLGIRVVDAQGAPASAAQHLLRGLFWPFEVLLMLPVSLGMLLIATTERRQRLGDLVAGTLVLREPRSGAAAEPFPSLTWAGLPQRRLALSPALAARFDAEDVRWLRAFFSRAGVEPAARARIERNAAEHFLGVLGRGVREGEERGELLRELYLYLRENRVV